MTSEKQRSGKQAGDGAALVYLRLAASLSRAAGRRAIRHFARALRDRPNTRPDAAAYRALMDAIAAQGEDHD